MTQDNKTHITRLQWHKFYVVRFNKTQHEKDAVLAMWFLLLHLALDNGGV